MASRETVEAYIDDLIHECLDSGGREGNRGPENAKQNLLNLLYPVPRVLHGTTIRLADVEVVAVDVVPDGLIFARNPDGTLSAYRIVEEESDVK